jgi:hypothetical protein
MQTKRVNAMVNHRSGGLHRNATGQSFECAGVRFGRFALGLPLWRAWRRDVSKAFSTEKAGEDGEATEQNKLRFARSAFKPYSVASTSSPASSVLKAFLNCGRHMFPGYRSNGGFKRLPCAMPLPQWSRAT